MTSASTAPAERTKPRGLAELPPLRRVRSRAPRVDLSRFPDFLMIGPQRTGTTWLYHNLRQHPQLFMPDVKETYYFSTLGQPGHPHFRFPFLEDYLDFFRDSAWRRVERHYDCLRQSFTFFRPRIFGEATATYATVDDDVLADITALNPAVKAIVLLRDPVDRAWSHAKKDLVRNAADPAGVPAAEFIQFLEKDSQRRRADYATILQRWEEALQPGRLHVDSYERIAGDPRGLLADIARFLDVTPHALFLNRHLRDRINPSREFAIPDPVRAHLEAQLANDRAIYRQLLEKYAPASRRGAPSNR